ncbi:MAG: CDP-alcohol phosphatidyltransferase [Rhodospirillaceae bacterium]|mgnify:FL=1|nr:CDP-alcohol phosphatidyltransferase [Rhodospirillaceae bacterium]|tara:strand:+ start:722 stop:1390 length:669 start_codon:yes stop_codon:yes gene_type:complete
MDQSKKNEIKWYLIEPWDQRLARVLISPLTNTAIHPNYLTTLRLLIGILACVFLAYGGAPWIHIGAGLFIFSNFLDHTDGEFARATGRVSRFGHRYDIICDLLINTFLFISIGLGLRNEPIGFAGLALGIAAGVSVAGLFYLFQFLENKVKKKQAGLPRFCGFEVEDILYLVGPIIWFGGAMPFLFIAAIGAPIFGFWAFWHYRKVLSSSFEDELKEKETTE